MAFQSRCIRKRDAVDLRGGRLFERLPFRFRVAEPLRACLTLAGHLCTSVIRLHGQGSRDLEILVVVTLAQPEERRPSREDVAPEATLERRVEERMLREPGEHCSKPLDPEMRERQPELIVQGPYGIDPVVRPRGVTSKVTCHQ